jgi:hypothetical protein
LANQGIACAALALSLAWPGAVEAQQAYSFETSPYWCDKLGGSANGSTCTAVYSPDNQACDKFARLNPDDAAMQQALEEIRQASVCLRDRVDTAKMNSLRLRADLMGYVSMGHDETVNDPISPNSGDMVSRASQGSTPYWPLASYYLHQCVVEVCEAK